MSNDFLRLPYFKYAVVQIVSTIFNNIHTLLLPVWYYELTGSKLASGTVFVVESIFALVALPFVGVIVDRFSHRLLILITEACRGIAVLSLLLVDQASPIVVVLAVAAVSSVGSTMFFALQQGVIRVNVPREQMPKAQALLSAVQGLALIGGPPAGAWLASVIGYKPVFALNAVSFVFSAASVVFIADAPLRKTPFKFLSDIREALDAARASRELWLLYVLQLSVYFAVGSLGLLFIFFFTERGFSLQAIALMMGAMGVGILAGSTFPGRISPSSLSVGALVAAGSGGLLFLLGSLPSLTPAIAIPVMIAFGTTSVSLGIFARTSIQKHAHAEMVGRMSALLRLCMLVGASLSVWTVVASGQFLSPALQLELLGATLLVVALLIVAAAKRGGASIREATDP